MVKVVVCDGHTLTRKGMASIINNSLNGFSTVGEAHNGIILLDMLQQGLEADVVILGMGMSLMDSYTIASKLSSMPLPPRILAFSMHHSSQIVNHMLTAGATGFINGECCEKSLANALSDMYNKGFHLNELVSMEMLRSSKAPLLKSDKKLLTKREEEMLVFLCSGKTYKEIATYQFRSYKTIDKHCQNIFRKLNVKSRNELVLKASQLGLALPGQINYL